MEAMNITRGTAPCSHAQIAYMNTTGGGVCVECQAYIKDEDVPAAVKEASAKAIAAHRAKETLECPCCGDDGAYANAAGEFADGQALTCGCPGWVTVEEEGEAWINNGDAPCDRCEAEK